MDFPQKQQKQHLFSMLVLKSWKWLLLNKQQGGAVLIESGKQFIWKFFERCTTLFIRKRENKHNSTEKAIWFINVICLLKQLIFHNFSYILPNWYVCFCIYSYFQGNWIFYSTLDMLTQKFGSYSVCTVSFLTQWKGFSDIFKRHFFPFLTKGF